MKILEGVKFNWKNNKYKRMKKITLLVLMIFCLGYQSALSQITCTTEKGYNDFPFTENELTITASGTGGYQNYASSLEICGVTTKPNSVYIGSSASTFTNTFSSPVNNMVYNMVAGNTGEIVTITTDTGGSLTITHENGDCPEATIINGNVISVDGLQGARLKVHSTNNFSTITFSHNGGGGGLLMTMCFDAVFASLGPTVTTTAMSGITSTTAVSGGNVTDDGGQAIIERGICWNTSGSPTITDSKTSNGTGTGSFSSNLTGLNSGSTYYVRAYATNSIGTGYGDEVSFTTTSNDTPSGSTIANQFECINGSASGLVLTITDNLPGDNTFIVTAASSNTSVVDNTDIVITGTGNTRSLTITPLLDAAGTSTITVSIEDSLGEIGTQTFDVSFNDLIAPSLTTVTDIDQDLDAECNFTIPDYTGLTTAADNCGTVTVTQSPISGTVISDHGTAQTITLTADDGNGNTNTTTFEVTLADVTPPSLTAVEDTFEDLDASCNFTVPDYTGLTTAADNCGAVTVTQSPISGTVISGHGTAQTITLTAEDGNGNTNTTTFEVTLADVTPPSLTAVEDTFEDLDASCNFTVPDYTGLTTAADNCGTVTITQSPISGTVLSGHATAQTITLAAEDGNGNTNTTTFNITLMDVTPPTAIAQDITVQLDANGVAAITPTQINNNSTDNCGITSISLDTTNFTCENIGENTVTLTTTDANGNEAHATAVVIVEDNIAPIVVVKDLTINLDETGLISIAAEEFIDESYDNCSISSLVMDRTNFDCANIGQYTLTLTATDSSGNTTIETAQLTLTGTDTDGDSIADSCDTDDDDDGIPDAEDYFPINAKPTLIPAQAFTPNGDGINDYWIIPGIENYANALIKVYNRWGHEVFASKGYKNDWNATYRSNSNKLPSGSYMYTIDLGNGTAPIQGWLFINY